MDKLREKIREVLGQPFHEIATSSDGVFTGYQLDHRTRNAFADSILAFVEPEIAKREREQVIKRMNEWLRQEMPNESKGK